MIEGRCGKAAAAAVVITDAIATFEFHLKLIAA